MFNVKIKVKEGNNTLPRTKRSTSIINDSNIRSGVGGGGGDRTMPLNGRNSSVTSSLRSSLASSNRSPSNSLKRKDKRVRIVTTCMPTSEVEYQQQQQFLLYQQQQLQHEQRLRQYGKPNYRYH